MNPGVPAMLASVLLTGVRVVEHRRCVVRVVLMSRGCGVLSPRGNTSSMSSMMRGGHAGIVRRGPVAPARQVSMTSVIIMRAHQTRGASGCAHPRRPRGQRLATVGHSLLRLLMLRVVQWRVVGGRGY